MNKIIDYRDIPNYLKQKDFFSPIYILIGTELLLLEETRESIIHSLKNIGFAYSCKLSTDKQIDWNIFVNNIKSISLFDKNRIFEIDINNTAIGTIDAEYLIDITNFLKQQKNSSLIIQIPKKERPNKNNKWLQLLLDSGNIINIPRIRKNELPKWIEKRLANQRQYVDKEVLVWISEKVENNLVIANQEIIKLGLLFGEGYIKEKDVKDSIVLNNSKPNIFDLRISILQGDIIHIITIINILKEENIAPSLILWAIYEDIRISVLLMESPKNNKSNILDKNKIFGVHREAINKFHSKIQKKFLYSRTKRIHEIDLSIKGLNYRNKIINIWDELMNLAIDIAKFTEKIDYSL